MANVTLIPDKYWQCDYGYITAMNPSTLYIANNNEPESTKPSIENRRAVFFEFDIPSDAVYRHGIVSDLVVNITKTGGPSNNGCLLYSNDDIDLDLALGKNVVSAGNRSLGYANPNVDYSLGDKFLRATNGKLYVGVIIYGSGYASFTLNAAAFKATYSNGTFAVTPSIAGGYMPATVPVTITLTPAYIATMITQYAVTSGVFYYKKTSELSYSSISFSGNSVIIPANTLEEEETYDYYFTAVSDDGTTTTSSSYTVSTGDMVGTVSAISPSNVVTYGRPTFTWLYENSLGNLPTAFDLQISTDMATWSDIANHEVSSETAYTADVAIGGSLYWRVRSYNNSDVASDWSNILSFSNVLPPSAPTITGVSGTGRITVSWNSSNQIAYQVLIGDHDSGWIYSPNKSYFLNEYLPDGEYEISVRVTNNIGLS